MDVRTCNFIALSEKYRNSVTMLRALKVVVENIAMELQATKKQLWASCLSNFNVNYISWNKSNVDIILILATCLPCEASGSNDLYNSIENFLIRLKSVDAYGAIAKLINDDFNNFGVTEWVAIRNLCSIALLPAYFERCVLRTVDAVLLQYLNRMTLVNWKECIAAFDMIAIESTLLSILGLLKVYS